MAKRKHKQTYNGHKHKFYIVMPDVYRCSYPLCRRWYKDVNWVLGVLNNYPGETFFRPWYIRDELLSGTVGFRR